MSAYEELEKIIQAEDQKSLDEWINKPREILSIFDDPIFIIRNASLNLSSVFGYKNAIKHGFIVNSTDLVYGCSRGAADVVDLLVEYVDPNEYSEYGRPLHIAIINEYPTIIDTLLRKRATPYAEDGFIAADSGDVTLVHKLYIHGLLPTAEMIEVAIRNENIPMVRAILDIHSGLQFSYEAVRTREMAMYFLIEIPDQQFALRMLKDRDPICLILLLANPRLAETIIDYTLEHNSSLGLRCIINCMHMIDINRFIEKITIIAARMNSGKLLKSIEYSNTKLDGYDYPIIEAIAAGSETVLRLFLERNFRTNIVSLRGLTPVMLAAALDETKILQLLLKHNAPLGSVNGHSPLSVAVAYNSFSCVEILKPLSEVMCYGDNCTENNEGREILINLQNANPSIKQIFQ